MAEGTRASQYSYTYWIHQPYKRICSIKAASRDDFCDLLHKLAAQDPDVKLAITNINEVMVHKFVHEATLDDLEGKDVDEFLDDSPTALSPPLGLHREVGAPRDRNHLDFVIRLPEGPPRKKQKHMPRDTTMVLLETWAHPVAVPELPMLLLHLKKPLMDHEKIPISEHLFTTLHQPSFVQPSFTQLTIEQTETLFRVSETDDAYTISRLVLVRIVDTPPPLVGTEDIFHHSWDDNISCLLQLILPSAELVRNNNHKTSTALKKPDLGLLLKNHCVFRGEEKAPQSSDDPREELIAKLIFTYKPLQFVLGYPAIGTHVHFVAIMPTTTYPLFDHDLRFRHQRVANAVHLIRLCGVLRWMGDTLAQRSQPEYKSFKRPDGLTHITIGAAIKKEFNHPDAASRVAHLNRIYRLLKEKAVPNVDELQEFAEHKPFYVILTPVGVDLIPSTSEESFEAVSSILHALKVLHAAPCPIYHRDIRETNIMKKRNENAWFLIDWSEASTTPTIAAPHLSQAGHSPRVHQDNHGGEVDMWGVGNYLKGLAARNRVRDSLQVTQIAKRWMADETITPSAALEEMEAARNFFLDDDAN